MDGTQANSVLSGRLLSSDEAPLVGITVELQSSTGQAMAFATTSLDGTFSFPQIPSGVYAIVGTVNGQRFSKRMLHSGTDISEADVKIDTSESRSPVVSPAKPGTVSVNDLQAPARAKKLFGKAINAIRERDFQRAIQYLDRVEAAAPQWWRGHFVRGVQLGRLQPAAQDLVATVKENPSSSISLALLGSIYERTKQYTLAEFYLRRAVSLSPPAWEANFELARLLYVDKHYAEAAYNARAALRLAPSEAQNAELILGEADAHLGNFSNAAAELQAYLAARPNAAGASQLQTQIRALQMAQVRHLQGHQQVSYGSAYTLPSSVSH